MILPMATISGQSASSNPGTGAAANTARTDLHQPGAEDLQVHPKICRL